MNALNSQFLLPFLSSPSPTWTFLCLLGSHLLSHTSTPLTHTPILCTYIALAALENAKFVCKIKTSFSCILLTHSNTVWLLWKEASDRGLFVHLKGMPGKQGTALTSFPISRHILQPPAEMSFPDVCMLYIVGFFWPQGRQQIYHIDRCNLLLVDNVCLLISDRVRSVSQTGLSASMPS